MPGLFRFDMYPRDWISGTRELSDRARGVYIDLLCRMYDLGHALDPDERDLCRFLGYRDYRQLRPVLDELIAKGKIVLVDGKLTNGRAEREIAGAHQRIVVGAKGGRPRKANSRASGGDEIGSRSGQDADLGATSSHSQWGNIEEKQGGSQNPSPSPSPSITEIVPISAADAAPDHKKSLYDLGTRVLGQRTGGMVTNLLKHHAGDIDAAKRTLERAAEKSNPREYVSAILNGDRRASADEVLAETDALYRRLGVI